MNLVLNIVLTLIFPVTSLKMSAKVLEARVAISKISVAINCICSSEDCSSNDSKDQLMACLNTELIDLLTTCLSKVPKEYLKKERCDENIRDIVKYCMYCPIVKEPSITANIEKNCFYKKISLRMFHCSNRHDVHGIEVMLNTTRELFGENVRSQLESDYKCSSDGLNHIHKGSESN